MDVNVFVFEEPSCFGCEQKIEKIDYVSSFVNMIRMLMMTLRSYVIKNEINIFV